MYYIYNNIDYMYLYIFMYYIYNKTDYIYIFKYLYLNNIDYICDNSVTTQNL